MELERKRSFIFCEKYKCRKRRNIYMYIRDLVLYQRWTQNKCIIDNNVYFTAECYGKSTFTEVPYNSSCFLLKSRDLGSFYEPRCLLLILWKFLCTEQEICLKTCMWNSSLSCYFKLECSKWNSIGNKG